MTEEQVVVTKSEATVESHSPPAKPSEKPVPAHPMTQAESVVGAGVRTQLREILDAGPITERSAGQMLRIVEQSIPLLQAVMGAKKMGARQGYAIAGVPTILGVIPLDEWSDAWGSGDGGDLRRAVTIARIAARRLKARLVGVVDERVANRRAESLDPALREKIVELLDRPYTPPVAKRLERLLAAVVTLLKAVGPARDRLPPRKRRKSVFGAQYIPLDESDWLAPSVPLPGEAPGFYPNLTTVQDDETEGGEAEDEEGSEPIVPSSPAETFGAKIFREIMAMAPTLMNAQRNTPENMVLAIVAAEREGCPQLAAKLRKLMGLEKPGEQETPKPTGLDLLKPRLRPIGLPVPESTSGYCSFMFGGFGDECGEPATKAAKNQNGHVELYCNEHHAAGLERGDVVDECTGAPSCAVAREKFGKDYCGVERGYCAHHYVEALAERKIVEGSDGHGYYKNGACVDCGRSVGAGHGAGCSAVAP